MSDDTPIKRKIIPASHISEITEVPPVEGILAKAVNTLSNELNRLWVRSSQMQLTDKESRILQGHVKTLLEISKEQRERAKAEDLSNMSDEELFELAKQVIAARESKNV